MPQNATHSRNQSDSPDLKITTIVSNGKRMDPSEAGSHQQPRYGAGNAALRNQESAYGNEPQRGAYPNLEPQPQSVQHHNSGMQNQLSYNYGALPSTNDQPLNLNFPKEPGPQERPVPQSARNPNARVSGRVGLPEQYSRRSG